jgi:Mg2+-importing ATPase
VSIAISSNFGNMVSMAIATPLLPFLPLLPKQILLNNFLADLPALAISTDRVDPEQLRRPQQWDVRFVRRFMLVFGLGSSLFDFISFGALLLFFHAGERLFHTGWFTESLMTQMIVVLVLRTRRLAWQSRPSKLLVAAMIAIFVLALALPYSGPLARAFDLGALTIVQTVTLLAIVAGYLLATEALKHWFYRHLSRSMDRAPRGTAA